MTPTRRALLGSLLLAGPAAVTTFALPAAAGKRDRSRAERYRFPTPNNKIDTGGAIIGINGPMAKVHAVVTDYARYIDILPRLNMSRIVGRKGKGTDVYLRAPILRGVNHVWAVTRFTTFPWRKSGKKVVSRYLKGNLDGFQGVWKMYACGPNRTILRMELFVDPQVPVPANAVTKDLEWASDKAVTAVRDIVECNRSTVKDD